MDWITNHLPVGIKIPLWLGSAFIVLLATMHLLSGYRRTDWTLTPGKGNRRLVVLVHGVPGRARFQSAVDLAQEALPDSDFLIFDYDTHVLSNESPYAISNVIERQINEAYETRASSEIVLVGHSLGGMLLRKALVWGNGLEEDRPDFDHHGKRKWVDHVSRFVSLASVNRGWSIDPRPKSMNRFKYLFIWIAERLARLSQSGQLILALQRGSPFIADARVQWIELCQGRTLSSSKIPQTIHLIGDRDDIVSIEDSMDLITAKDTIFVTLEDTGHHEIASALGGGGVKLTKIDEKRFVLHSKDN